MARLKPCPTQSPFVKPALLLLYYGGGVGVLRRASFNGQAATGAFLLTHILVGAMQVRGRELCCIEQDSGLFRVKAAIQ
jgi:hypothetical protein